MLFTWQGGYAGDAQGFKVASLNKLTDTRSSQPQVTLLHYLVEEAEEEDHQLLDFVEGIGDTLRHASRWTSGYFIPYLFDFI